MPRQAKGPRLYLDPQERTFVIRDGPRKRRTGCGEGERARAEAALRDYITEKYEPVSDRRPDCVLVADALTFYLREVAPRHRASATTAYCVERLLDWWKARPLSDVKRSTCREYVAHRIRQPIPQARSGEALKRRVSTETARRELTVLRAAINAYHAEHALKAVPVVTLPPASAPRDRALTRAEAAALIRAARAHPERPARTALIRFILIGLYTGTRPGAIRSLGWMRSTVGGWIDVDAGVIHRRPDRATDARKRRPPARLPRRLLAHLRRWREIDGEGVAVIHHGGRRISAQRRAWAWARSRADLGPDVVPHILRHTAVTWAMQGGADLWQAAGYFGMSPEILWEVYGHHHPDWQHDVAERGGRRPGQKPDRLA